MDEARRRTGVRECPHCFLRVLPRQDGTCPNCGKDTRDLSGTEPDKQSCIIRQGQELPPICIRCGQNTKRGRTVAVTKAMPDSSSGLAGGCALALLLGWIWGAFYLLWKSSRNTVSWSMRVPVCRTCARAGKITPVKSDVDERWMKLVVHRDFAAALANAGGAADPSPDRDEAKGTA